jgi:hypothetical protein
LTARRTTRLGKAAREKNFLENSIGSPGVTGRRAAPFAIDQPKNLDDSGTKDSKIV